MLSLRARIFIIISVIVLFILGISLLLLYNAKKKGAVAPTSTPESDVVATSDNNESTFPVGAGPGSAATAPVRSVPSDLDVEKNSVRQLARIFTERYNTYSSDNDSQNIREVENLVTPALWAKIGSKIGNTKTAGFVGVTTKAVSTKLDSWQTDSAQVSLQLIRNFEQNGVREEKQETLQVNLVKASSGWLVDSFVWQK